MTACGWLGGAWDEHLEEPCGDEARYQAMTTCEHPVMLYCLKHAALVREALQNELHIVCGDGPGDGCGARMMGIESVMTCV